MASIVFVAVQCCQCSTMQVKQKKKSGNKWSCAICNQKQSVRKIHAQGFQAKDVRKFVQNFNMSRQSLDEALDSAEPEEAEIVEDPSTKNDSFDFRKRRSDWSEYLESDEDKLENQFGRGDQEEEPRGGSEPNIMTEIPKEMFKKPKLKNYSLEQRKSDGNKPFSPKFSKRKTTKSFVSQGAQQEPEKSHQPTLMARGPSKWADYLTEEDDDKLLFSGGEDLRDPQCPWSQAFQDTRFQDEIVGDEVHPEFI